MTNDWSFLNGMRIVDLSRLLPGPFATQTLADLGAEVIKIEEPKHGDPGRRLGKDMFARLNRNKKSLTLDLKSDEGKAVLTDLLKGADAVIESFRPGVMERLGFGYEDVCALNPAIVYCSLSGFGQTGPYRQRAGHDIDFLALSGYFAVPSQVNDKLARPKVRLSDYAGAMYGALSLAVAMGSAKMSGKGQYLDVAITDAMVNWSAPLVRIAHELCEGDPDKMSFVMPDNDIFETSDGGYIAIGLFENKFWVQLATMMDSEFPQLGQPEYATNQLRNQRKREVHTMMTEMFASKSLVEWESLFRPTDLPWAVVYQDMRLFDDPHLQDRGMFGELGEGENKSFQAGYPTKFSGGLNEFNRAPPSKGQDTDEILRGLGHDDAAIQAMRDAGVI
ncbi:CaiB/BaiF CoA-transferase family protein [Ruegeria sp. Ofav3-42]|uniref:CaiB/BaiF CoA transferase family protein n=1 Tax=Ruegeria sp. Ofav3-42 TaxID=2917759 RepID=UPI001EF46B53|nr:CaiB/BaiF CoA-transferase family protein [Ruegeria sp. Ofav3-42]MCG7521431.1 CoA transferase [Ruegeria sp. Ofav3-42]